MNAKTVEERLEIKATEKLDRLETIALNKINRNKFLDHLVLTLGGSIKCYSRYNSAGELGSSIDRKRTRNRLYGDVYSQVEEDFFDKVDIIREKEQQNEAH